MGLEPETISWIRYCAAIGREFGVGPEDVIDLDETPKIFNEGHTPEQAYKLLYHRMKEKIAAKTPYI